MNKRKICVVTGSRADYGHLKSLIEAIARDPGLSLQLVITGSHLESKFGNTYKDIEQDGFTITRKLKLNLNDASYQGIGKAIGTACGQAANAFAELKPDMVVILGDRYEVFAIAVAAYMARLPLVHIHGGETSQGAVDEAFRHAITKMSHFHFVATDPYRKRVVQLGEDPRRVFNFGAPGLDELARMAYTPRRVLMATFGLDPDLPTGIATWHPVTLEASSLPSLTAIFKALQSSPCQALFTKANADRQGAVINRVVEDFCRKHPRRFVCVDNLGRQKYLSCLKFFDFMIGNSSSGLIEAPSFGLPVINIGDRQKGRIKGANVIDAAAHTKDIQKAIRKALSRGFRSSLKRSKNPYVRYADGKAGWRIKEKIKRAVLNEQLLKKEFYDLPH